MIGLAGGVRTNAWSQQPRRDSTRAQQQLHGRLLGVYDQATGDPIVGADVTDVLTGDHTRTSATGTVSLWFVRAKGTIVEVRKLGYEPWQAAIDPSDTTAITVLLNPVAELPAVRTTARPNIAEDAGVRDGFERRCQAANVSCVREDVIDSHPSTALGDLLFRAPGIVPRSGVPTMRANGGGLCRPTYYVDGFRWTGPPLPPIDPAGKPPGGAPFNASNVEKIEVYPPYAVRPLRFAGDASCGVIAIWTK